MQIKNLTIRLKKDGRTIIDNLTFSINDGDRLALIGEEGNGKSTLLKAITNTDDFLSYAEISGEISRDEPEIAKAFLDRLKNYESMVTTYCASCSIQFTKNQIPNQHALTMILGTNEKVVPTSLARLIKMKFYGGR